MEENNEAAASTGGGLILLSQQVVPFLLRIGTLLMGLAAIAGGVLYVKQDRLLYFPEIGGIPRRPADNPHGYRSPEERQIDFESHMIPCADGVHIHAWLLKAATAAASSTSGNKQQALSAPTIIFFHGNAGNIGLRLPNAMQMLQYLNANILMVEYRGYGNSDSVDPTETGLKLDAEASLKFTQQHDAIDSSKVFLFGRSLGGSVALHLAEYAANNGIPLAGCMVENTYTSISAMVDQLMPFLKPIKFAVLRIGWDSTKIVPRLSIPLLFLAGGRDELVPHHHMVDLHRAAVVAASGGGKNNNNNLVRMHIIPDGTHNESWMQGGPPYWDSIRSFMGAALQQETRISSSTTSSTSGVVTNDVKSSIPVMSSRFMDIAKEAVGGGATSNNNNGQKKEL